MAVWTDLTNLAYKAVLSSTFVNTLLENTRYLKERADTLGGDYSGALWGVAPSSSAQPLRAKVFVGSVTTAADGTREITLPGAAFANGLVDVEVLLARGDGTSQSAYQIQVISATASKVTIRVAQLVSGNFQFLNGGSLAIALRAYGW